MSTVAYLLLGLAVIGALAYALYEVTARQRRLMAELTRLERLTAEVAMSAEAVLDEVDRRVAQLKQLADALAAGAPGAAEPARPARRQRGGARTAPRPAQEEAPAVPHDAAQEPEPEAAAQTSPDEAAGAAAADRYAGVREAVCRMADEGKSPLEIAEALQLPRGEVQLILNLRGKSHQMG
ncbi:putative membrane protein [Symbiobacterium terraclitae]|uniref:Membrane protein n=1 Tax=Symbiobacterium terraclitae TaxID=557451 RepID=A0ABS4JNA5_9FIRM|nr:hypothetical protein [Symbiobacterium terraclitae]MBP2017013.1 putative membrane protein [Symbiobacterium terraclitae]